MAIDQPSEIVATTLFQFETRIATVQFKEDNEMTALQKIGGQLEKEITS